MIRIPEGVGWTALLTAYGRAQESREAAKQFDDPLASTFLAAVGSSEHFVAPGSTGRQRQRGYLTPALGRAAGGSL
jgi:O-methyltransferase involved in polyketide biosynthesis